MSIETYEKAMRLAKELEETGRLIRLQAETIYDNLEPEHADGNELDEECCAEEMGGMEGLAEDLKAEIEELRTALDEHKKSMAGALG